MSEVEAKVNPKFKVGDVVTPLPYESGRLHEQLILGALYVVEAVHGQLITVKGEFREGGNGRDWGEEWFKLAENPLQESTAESLRKYILTIRKEREELVKQLEGIDVKENEAIQKLAGLGFLLKEEPESAPVTEDMSNPENWKIGDVFEVLSTENAGMGEPDGLEVGDVLPLTKTGVHQDEASFKLGHGCSTWVRAHQIKFLSRPL